MKTILSTALLLLAAGPAFTAEAPDKDGWKLGVVGSAARSASIGTFTVFEQCEKRFPDLQAEGAAIMAAYTSRNAQTAEKMAALTAKLAARLKARYPGENIDAVLAEVEKAGGKTAGELYEKMVTTALDSAKLPRVVCATMYAEINKGAMDITKIQKSANKVLLDSEIGEFLAGYKGLSIQDGPENVQASGTWTGTGFPVNAVHITATRADKTMRLSSKTLVDLGTLAPSHMSASETTVPIESWSEDVIRSVPIRLGTSQRFAQYVIDRKLKSVSEIFTGESPGTHALADASGQFRDMQARFP